VSLSKETTVWCDGCGEWEQSADPAPIARRRLPADGWRVGVTGERYREQTDYCPACASTAAPGGDA
jgi:hypothetical protein